MPRLKFSGHPDGVDLPVGEFDRTVHVAHGHEVDVTASVRDRLLKQDPDAWTEIKRDTGKSASHDAPAKGEEG